MKLKFPNIPFHINAKTKEIANIVFIVGDPLRATYIAEKMLNNYKLVSKIRNMYFYTGLYKGQKVTIGSSGMGCPSMGIYSHELFKFYNVKVLIRLGSSCSYQKQVSLCDLINVESVYTKSTYPLFATNLKSSEKDNIRCKLKGVAEIFSYKAKELGFKIYTGKVLCSDVFTPWYQYLKKKNDFKLNKKEKECLVAEMETAALFVNANLFQRYAGCLLTVSDSIFQGEFLSVSERETNLNRMIKLAFYSLPKLKELIKND